MDLPNEPDVVQRASRRVLLAFGLGLAATLALCEWVEVRAAAAVASSVSLDPTLKDAWGLPALRVTYKDHPDDLSNVRFLPDRGVEIAAAAGALKITRTPIVEQKTAMHLLGTCRMGDDPASSVIDRYHRTHDVRNLFPCDGSSLVTSGRGQPTMTIQALAFRAAEHLGRFARRGEI